MEFSGKKWKWLQRSGGAVVEGLVLHTEDPSMADITGAAIIGPAAAAEGRWVGLAGGRAICKNFPGHLGVMVWGKRLGWEKM